MPLSSLASYLSTTEEFVTHWNNLNDTLDDPLLLPGSFGVANLTAMRNGLQTAITAVETPLNAKQNAANDRDIKRAALRERLRQFRLSVQGQLSGSKYVKSLPVIPDKTSSEGIFLKAMDDMQSLWNQINTSPPAGFTGPLLLVAGYTRANHLTDVTALRATYTTWSDAVRTVKLRIAERDALLDPIRAILIQYRQIVQSMFTPDSSWITSLPAVTPRAGATPAAVTLSFVWNATTNKADFSWNASDNDDLKEYSLRACDPPSYKADEEAVVTTIDPPATSVSSNFGLGASGAVKKFKVYVVTNDDNEKGSNVVTVTRP